MSSRYINIHTHRPTGLNTELRVRGTHPWAATSAEAELPLALSAEDQAVGEIGLDFACAVPRENQKAVFRRQLQVARERNLPVVLHCVRAFNEVMRILREERTQVAIFHGFIGSKEQAAEAVRRGFYLSFGLRTFRSPKTCEALRLVPLDHLFLETDDDDVTIKEIYRRAAAIRGVSVTELQDACIRNYKLIFETNNG